MGIEKFIKGVFRPDSKEQKKIEEGETEIKEKYDQATERLQIEQEEERQEIIDFIMEFELAEILKNVNESEQTEIVNDLKKFVDKKSKIEDHERSILENEVEEKAKKMVEEKLSSK